MTDETARLQALLSEPSSDAPDDEPRRARVERTGAELATQGRAVAETLAGEAKSVADLAQKIAARRIRRVVIAGCGDSWFAAIGARLAFERLTGLPTEPVQAFDWGTYASGAADDGTLVVGLSSGGNTPAVMGTLERAAARGAFTVGMSNTADSPILARFDGALRVRATRRGWPTQSSTAALALLIRLAAEIARSRPRGDLADPEALLADLQTLPALMDGVVGALDTDARAAAERWAEARLVLFAGAGPHLAAAAFGAAKVKELSPIHALALPVEEYHHYRSQKAGDPLFLLSPDEASRERCLDTILVSRHLGGRTIVLLGREDREIEDRAEAAWRLPPVRAELAPLLYAVPLHLFAYHFARERFARRLGYPPALAAEAAA